MDTHSKAKELAERPYVVRTTIDTTTFGNPIYFARVLEIDGCFGQGNTVDSAVEDLHHAMVDYIASLLNDGLDVPEPTRQINGTVGTATQGSYTYIKQGQRFQPKQIETSQDAYLFVVQVG